MMSRSFFKRLFFVTAMTASVGASCLNAAEVPARVLKHTQSDGQAVQALMFQLPEGASGVVSHDHLVFIDTSASQIGAHRSHAMSVLESMLKALPETDRVRLFAVDVQAEALMPSFANATSKEVLTGLSALNTRIPLGATNIKAVIQAALDAKDPNRECSITYIGDGMSTANLLETKELSRLVARLRNQKTPFNGYGVGPQINLQVLGVLAHQTGGYVDFDNQMDSAESGAGQTQVAAERGRKLAQAVQRPVFFPTHVEITSEAGMSLPLLPLRSDRETIHVIRGVLPADAKVTFSNQNDQSVVAAKRHSFDWNLSAPIEQPGSAFLFAVAQQMDQDQGLSNSLAGRGLMQVYQRTFAASVESALQFGTQQLNRGQADAAAEVARRVVEVDPSNSTAQSLALASNKLRVRQVSQITDKEEESELEAQTRPNPNSSLTLDQEQAIRVKTEKLRNQVNNSIDESRKGDPDSGLVRLKQADNAVRSSIDIAPEDRLQLRKRLEGEISQLKNASDKRNQEKVQLAEQLSQLESQKRLSEQFQLDEEKLEGLIERVRGLMIEGRHGRDEAYGEAQNVADVAINLRPGEGTSSAARFDSEAAQQLNRAYRLRARRADQLLETLNQVELAHIPFPDEPPVRYPPAEVWKALSERRRKWASVDLHRDSPVERKIIEELKSTTEVNFTDIPLKDALDFIKETHHIEIWPDQKAMSDEGISIDQTVTLVMSGISLRSVLRLLLEPLLLTYVIQDEVLKITTQTVADEKLQSRVYPVADLVVPIISGGGGMGGGMGGGGMGGGGMGGGGMGGGMGGGGMGGMGGGMGGGGMGGGFFSVPPEQVPANPGQAKPADAPKLDNKSIQNLKKKRDR